MASAAVKLVPAHLGAEKMRTGLSDAEHNVLNSVASRVTVVVPNVHHRLNEDDHVEGATYLMEADAPVEPLLFNGKQAFGQLIAIHLKDMPGDAATVERVGRAIDSVCAEASRTSPHDEGYTLGTCYSPGAPTQDASAWKPRMNPTTDWAGLYSMSDTEQTDYYLVIKTDAGPVLSGEVQRLVKASAARGETNRQLSMGSEFNAAKRASQRNARRLGAMIADRAGVSTLMYDDKDGVYNAEAFEAPPQLAKPAVEQQFNTLSNVRAENGSDHKYMSYADKACPVTYGQRTLLLPISAREGIRVLHLKGDGAPSTLTSSGLPLGIGRAESDAAALADELGKLQRRAAANAQVSTQLNKRFAWSGRENGHHDNPELVAHRSFSDEEQAMLDRLLGERSNYAMGTLQPVRVWLSQ